MSIPFLILHFFFHFNNYLKIIFFYLFILTAERVILAKFKIPYFTYLLIIFSTKQLTRRAPEEKTFAPEEKEIKKKNNLIFQSQ